MKSEDYNMGGGGGRPKKPKAVLPPVRKPEAPDRSAEAEALEEEERKRRKDTGRRRFVIDLNLGKGGAGVNIPK